jgi:putative membrane protein
MHPESRAARISEARRGRSQRIASLILEIACVLAQASSDAVALPILMAALVALALPWLMVAFTAVPVDRILLLQVVVFFVLADCFLRRHQGNGSAA